MKVVTAILGFVLGAVLAYALCFAVYIAFTVITDYYDREGATSMMVAFFIGPIAALIGGIVAAIWAVRRRSVREASRHL